MLLHVPICSIGVWRVIYLVRKGIEYKAIWWNVCHIVDCSPNQVKIPINIYSGPFVVSRPNAEIKRIYTPWCTEKKHFSIQFSVERDAWFRRFFVSFLEFLNCVWILCFIVLFNDVWCVAWTWEEMLKKSTTLL